MNPNLRACVANIVARLNGQGINSAVYDHTQGKHIHVTGNVNGQSVTIYDHESAEHHHYNT
jgi:hypothetical protein